MKIFAVFILLIAGMSLIVMYFFSNSKSKRDDDNKEEKKREADDKKKEEQIIDKSKREEREKKESNNKYNANNREEEEYGNEKDEDKEEKNTETETAWLKGKEDVKPVELFQMGVAYKMYFKDIEKIADLIMKMYDEKILAMPKEVIRSYVKKSGIYEERALDSVVFDIIESNFDKLDKPTLSKVVNTTVEAVKQQLMNLLPPEIRNDENFKYGIQGKE